MASDRRVQANRQNSRRSTGPRSRRGKAVSAMNALRHGILARSPVVDNVESEAEWQLHYEAVVSALAPEGYMELALVRRVALQIWRLERLGRYETALAHARITGIAPEEAGSLTDSVVAAIDGFVDAARDRNAFEAITQMRAFETVPSVLAIRILTRIAAVNGLEFDAGATGFDPDAPHGQEEEARWPASEVVRRANEIGENGGVCPDQALSFSVNAGTRGWGIREVRLRELREQRLLPEACDLDVLQRYEASLERGLFRALHEIERLQAHRLGGDVVAPIAVELAVST